MPNREPYRNSILSLLVWATCSFVGNLEAETIFLDHGPVRFLIDPQTGTYAFVHVESGVS